MTKNPQRFFAASERGSEKKIKQVLLSIDAQSLTKSIIKYTFIALLQVMAIGAMVKSALEIDEDTMIQFHVHREEKHKGAGAQKIFI